MIHAFLFVVVLLLAGVVLRSSIRLFKWLYIPASVIAGGLGLLVVQLAGRTEIRSISEVSTTLSDWPSWLIAIVFAGMLLERESKPAHGRANRVGRQGLMVWIIVLGETAVGLLATWLLVLPNYDLPNSFAMLIETGFAGGHGTAGAMGEVFKHESIGLEAGLDLGILMATCGLVYGIVTGILWINVAVKRKWIDPSRIEASNQRSSQPTDHPPIGYATIGSDTLDPLLMQIIWLALAFAIGMGMQAGVLQLAGWIDTFFASSVTASGAQQELSSRLTVSRICDFPLFIYTLFGGWFVRRGLRSFGRENLIDHGTIVRLTSTSMDVLVVAAIATLNLSAVVQLIVPFSILLVCGCVWTSICLLLISRWILPAEYWFQLGLINYGMSTGTTATGFVLLRIVDPELETDAAEDYALAAPLSAPFIGGGILTIAMPLLVLERVPIAASAIVLTTVVIALVLIGRRWNQSLSGHPETL